MSVRAELRTHAAAVKVNDKCLDYTNSRSTAQSETIYRFLSQQLLLQIIHSHFKPKPSVSFIASSSFSRIVATSEYAGSSSWLKHVEACGSL